MFSTVAEVLGGSVMVATTNNGGATPETLAERALDKIIYVGGNAHPAIREQAMAFRDSIKGVLLGYLKEAARAERATIAMKLKAAGHGELIKLLDS